MTSKIPATLTTAALLILSLAACTTAGAGSGTGTDPAPDPGSASGAGTVAECVMGHTWNADVPNMAQQLLTQLQSNGSPATSATGTGTQTLKWGLDGHVLLTTDYIFTVVLPLEDGLIMTMKQSHVGPASGSLMLDGDTATPAGDWDSTEYVVTTAVDINGTASDTSFPIGDAGVGNGAALTVTCEGNVMTTFAQGGFVTQKWDNFGD